MVTNPFAKREATSVVDNRSAFERLPPEYLHLCNQIRGKLSPQNRNVRAAADAIWISRGNRPV